MAAITSVRTPLAASIRVSPVVVSSAIDPDESSISSTLTCVPAGLPAAGVLSWATAVSGRTGRTATNIEKTTDMTSKRNIIRLGDEGVITFLLRLGEIERVENVSRKYPRNNAGG